MDDLPGGANDAPTAPQKVAGSLGLGSFLSSGVCIIQNNVIQCLKELGFLSIDLNIWSVSSAKAPASESGMTQTNRALLHLALVLLGMVMYTL